MHVCIHPPTTHIKKRGVLQELDSVVTRARMFKNKPDGDVTIETMVDDEGKPVRLFQDPLHYPHDTKFMAPGTFRQLHTNTVIAYSTHLEEHVHATCM